MSRADLLLILNALRNSEPMQQANVPEWAEAIAVVVREITRAVEDEYADR